MPAPQSAAYNYAVQKFGGPVVENETNPSVTTSVSDLIGPNGDRVALIIVNTGANDFYVGLSAGVSSSNGIRVTASGGNVLMDITEDFTLPSRGWKVVGAGASTAYVLEIIRFSQMGSPSPADANKP